MKRVVFLRLLVGKKKICVKLRPFCVWGESPGWLLFSPRRFCVGKSRDISINTAESTRSTRIRRSHESAERPRGMDSRFRSYASSEEESPELIGRPPRLLSLHQGDPSLSLSLSSVKISFFVLIDEFQFYSYRFFEEFGLGLSLSFTFYHRNHNYHLLNGLSLSFFHRICWRGRGWCLQLQLLLHLLLPLGLVSLYLHLNFSCIVDRIVNSIRMFKLLD